MNNDRNLYVCILFIRLMDTAREMIKESLPIKCLEAVIVGLYPLQKEAIALILQVQSSPTEYRMCCSQTKPLYDPTKK